MGTEMIAKATQSFERKQRRCLEQLGEQTLFTCVPEIHIAVVANAALEHTFSPQAQYRLAARDGQIVVVDGVTVIGFVDNPPANVAGAIVEQCLSIHCRVTSVFAEQTRAELQLE